jgi:hypothetical protein
MATVREKVIADASRGEKQLSARRLFVTFCAHARRSYKYSATKIKGNEGSTLLARPEAEIVTVDCASLADAFVELLNESFQNERATRVEVGHGNGFATPAGSRCFDTEVLGNIRKPAEGWGETKRCVFSKHYFVESGSQTRTFYDPCMFTTYSTLDEPKSWLFETGLMDMVKRVQGKPTVLLIRLPTTYQKPMPKGFASGFIEFQTSDMTKDEYAALWGRKSMPRGWNDAKYDRNKAAAVDKVNKLLRERAGVNATWSI